MKTALQGRFSIPDSNTLHADLTSVGYKYTSDGRLLLEAKEDMKKRGMPSPDGGDAVALCFSEPNGSPIPRTSGFDRQIEYPDNAYDWGSFCLRNGSTNDDTGQVTTGYYTLADGVLTTTDSKGVAVRDLNTGEKVTRKIKPDEDPRTVASRLTMQIYRMERGDGMGGLNRRLVYPTGGIA